MWGKHFAKSIIIIGKWNQVRAMYNEQCCRPSHENYKAFLTWLGIFLYYYAVEK